VPDNGKHPGLDLLTADEVIKLLRLDQLGLKQPREALRNLRRTRRLGYVEINRRILYPRSDVEEYLDKQHHPATR